MAINAAAGTVILSKSDGVIDSTSVAAKDIMRIAGNRFMMLSDRLPAAINIQQNIRETDVAPMNMARDPA